MNVDTRVTVKTNDKFNGSKGTIRRVLFDGYIVHLDNRPQSSGLYFSHSETQPLPELAVIVEDLEVILLKLKAQLPDS